MAYIVQTNPWGGGDEDASSPGPVSKRSSGSGDEFATVGARDLANREGFHVQHVASRDDLPPGIRDVVDDFLGKEGTG
jgi:hypothetical protein